MTEQEALQKAVETLGSAAAVGRAVGRTPQAVSDILRRGRPAPLDWCKRIERATRQMVEANGSGTVVTAEQLRPDAFSDESEEEAPSKARRAS